MGVLPEVRGHILIGSDGVIHSLRHCGKENCAKEAMTATSRDIAVLELRPSSVANDFPSSKFHVLGATDTATSSTAASIARIGTALRRLINLYELCNLLVITIIISAIEHEDELLILSSAYLLAGFQD